MIIYIDKVARVAHEVQRAFLESVGDHTLIAWDQNIDSPGSVLAELGKQKRNAENGVHMYLQVRQDEMAGVESMAQKRLDELEANANDVTKSAQAIFRAVVLAICEPRNAAL